MVYISSIERRGLEKGLQQGLEQGLQKGLEQGLEQGLQNGLLKAIVKILTLRFGPVSASVQASLTGLTAERLEDLSVQAATADSLPAFQAYLD